jgi:hypothetical protein
MQCRELERVLERSGGEPLSPGAAAHLETCRKCRSLVSDLETIAAVARTLPREIEPPSRVWTALRAQLVAERIIHDKPERAGWLASVRAFLAGPSLATGAVGLLILAAALVVWKMEPQAPVAQQAQVAPHPALVAASDMLQVQERGVTDNFGLTDSTVDLSLRENLVIVDNFIAECERRMQEEPDNDLAREYLSNAYEQKATLLATMMDRTGGSN